MSQMSVLARLKSPRPLVVITLLTILLVNIYISMRNTELVAPTNMGLNNSMEFSNDYIESLRKDILEGKQNELVDEIKKSLHDKLYPEIERKVKAEVDVKVRPNYEKKIKEDLEKSLSLQYMSTYKLDYVLIENMAAEYLKDNIETIKQLSLLDLASSINSSATDGSASVESALNEVVSRKKWFDFVLRNVILDSAPTLGPLTTEEKGNLINDCGFIINPMIYDKNHLSRVHLSSERMSDFKKSHGKIFQHLSLMEAPSRHIFHGKGIIISGGGAYTAGALVSIIQVRELGSKLPIELILNDNSEYDEYICKEMGSKFNFKCVIMQNELGAEIMEKLKITKFQAKVMGILASSFDHVICLDADNMPLINPDELLTSSAYFESEFLLWPDLWHRTISPLYYDIAGIQSGQVVRRGGIPNSDDFIDYSKNGNGGVHFHDLDGLPDTRSTETGQMVFSKTRHFRSFILALYYNVYGESHYWHLMYQGSPGSGDRDTFVPALHVFHEPYHVVRQNTWLAGFDRADGKFQETTIVQYDPTSSYAYETAWKNWLKSKNHDSRMLHYQNNDKTKDLIKEFWKQDSTPAAPKVFFLHIHRPKINFVEGTSETNYFDWDKQRNLGKYGRYKNEFGDSDWELRFYSISQWLACKGIQSETWWKSVKRDQKAACKKVSAYVKFLLSDSKDSKAQAFKTIDISEASA